MRLRFIQLRASLVMLTAICRPADKTIVLRATAILMALLVASATASAQGSTTELTTSIKKGLKVAVTDTQGREFKGRIVEVGDDSLTLTSGGETPLVPYTDIVKLDRVDDLKNGSMIGLIVGAGLFVADAWYSHESGIELNAAGYAVFGALYCGLGAGAGAGIDALIGGNKNIYQRGRPTRVSLTPLVGRDKVRVVLAISW